MKVRRYLTAAQARGLAVALLVNAALLALLAVGPATKLHLPPEVPSPVVILGMFRPPPRRPVEPVRKLEEKPPQEARPSPVAPRPSLAPAAPAAPLPAAPAPVMPSTPGPAGAATGGDGTSAAGAAAVRHLLGCAAFARRRDGDDCDTRRSGDPAHIDGLTPEKRLSLGPTSRERRDELIETNRELQTQTFQPQGSRAARFGCNMKAGKWKCSTY